MSGPRIGMLKISSIARDPAKDFGENIHQESTQEHETIELNNETQEQQDNSAHQGASSAPSIHFQSGNKCSTIDLSIGGGRMS